MRTWQLTLSDPLAPRFAADARSGRTTFADDQSWQVRLGTPQEPALALETRYGGRVGLARLVPIWTLGQRQVTDAQAYHRAPVITAFAPDYVRLSAALTLTLDVAIEVWVMESRAIGGRFTLTSTAQAQQTVQAGLTAQAIREERELQRYALTLENGAAALQTFRLPHLQPVLLLEGAVPTPGASARLSRQVTLQPGESVRVRWVLASLEARDDSLALAHKWLMASWEDSLALVAARLEATPDIATGHADWDAALAWGQQVMLRSFLGATDRLPHPSIVRTRKPNQGYAVNGTHASGLGVPWGGQSMVEALHVAGTAALAAPELAAGLVRNFLSVQQPDGWIDARPGLDGQRSGVLAPPLLGTLALTVYEFTGDRAVLTESLDGAIRLIERWFAGDMDRSGDGLPEWSTPEQGAFADSPTLAQHQRWAEGVDVTTLHAPDLAALIAREIHSVQRIAQLLEQPDRAAALGPRLEALRDHLARLWDDSEGRFRYADRETHASPAGELVFSGKGDGALSERLALSQPARLLVRVSGGMSHKPALRVIIEGVNAAGQPAHEEIPDTAFGWYRGQGSATSATAWSAVTFLRCEGLSRVFTVEVRTPDLTRPDMSHLVPLWSGLLSEQQAARLIAALTDPAQYGCAYGVPGGPVNSPAYDAAHRSGCGGVWPEWNARLARALIEVGRADLSADLFRRVLGAAILSLRAEQGFRRFYHPETGEGLGDSDDILGVPGVDWFARLFGAWPLTPGAVRIHAPFAFAGETMTWTQYGITVTRSDEGTQIRFPSGHEVDLPPDAPPGVIRDPKYRPAPPKPVAPSEPVAPPDRIAPPRADDDLLPDGT